MSDHPIPAAGLTGYIYKSFTGEVYFRVYGEDFEFQDYELTHPDLQVTITDTTAFLLPGRIDTQDIL